MHTIKLICAWKCGEHMKMQHISVLPWASDFMEIHSNILHPICPLKNKPPLLTEMPILNKYDCPMLAGLPIKKRPPN